MKKTVALILSAILALCLFAGCGTRMDSETSVPTTARPTTDTTTDPTTQPTVPSTTQSTTPSSTQGTESTDGSTPSGTDDMPQGSSEASEATGRSRHNAGNRG